MKNRFVGTFQGFCLFRFNPSKDLVVVAISWLLVFGSLYTATVIVGPTTGGGLPYFFLYAVLCATIFGIGVPVCWMVIIRKRPLSDLGITTRWLGWSLFLQIIFALLQYLGGLTTTQFPSLERFIPLVSLALSIGFFEAVFWRGWILLRLEEAFGLIPAILLGSGLYAIYHIGYAMPVEEISFLFWIGVLYAIVFRLTRNVFILWPVLQPMGQLITLMKDELDLPLIASLGFVEVLVVMFVLIWLVYRSWRKSILRNPSHNLQQATVESA